MSKIHEKIHLGTYEHAEDRKWLKENKITHILIASTENLPCFPKKYNYKKYDMFLVATFDPAPFLDQGADYLKECQDNEKCKGVLVHDYLGDSRALALVLSYIMKYLGYAFDHAFKEVMERRHEVRISPHYKDHIKTWGFTMIRAKNRAKFMKKEITELGKKMHHDIVGYLPDPKWRDENKNYSSAEMANAGDFDTQTEVRKITFDPEGLGGDAEDEEECRDRVLGLRDTFQKTDGDGFDMKSQASWRSGVSSAVSKLSKSKSSMALSQANFRPSSVRVNSSMARNDQSSQFENKRYRTKQNGDEGSPAQSLDRPHTAKARPNSGSVDLIFKVVSKPFKTEYENEFGGGRLEKDPRQRESQKRWYIPKYNCVGSRCDDNSQTSGMSFVRKQGKITGTVRRQNFNRFKRIQHPLVDGKPEGEHLARLDTEEGDPNSPNQNSVSVEMQRPNTNRPEYTGSLGRRQTTGKSRVSKPGVYQRVFPKQPQHTINNSVYTIPYKGGGNILTRKFPYDHKRNL
jgi:hypothetical protein